MLAVNYTNLRGNMKMYMDKVTEDYETIIVTRKDICKLLYLKSIRYYNRTIESLWPLGY